MRKEVKTITELIIKDYGRYAFDKKMTRLHNTAA